jgi:toluene monooxygenase system ferredoxin subunit
MAFHAVARVDEVWEGELRTAAAAGRRLVLLRAGDRFVAYEDRCVHLGVPISAGRLDRGVLTCGAHHWQYDAATGCGTNPANVALRSFPTRVRDGAIEVDLPPEDAS